MASLAVAAMTRLYPALSQRSILHNRSNWLIPATACNYAKSAEDKLGLDKPKRPLTPFLKFATQMRPALQAKNPGTDTVQVLKLAAKHWQQLGADAKSTITKEYKENMEDYLKLKAKYEASLTDAQRDDIKRVRLQMAAAKEKRKVKAEYKELGRPKRPMSSYILYCQTEKENISSMGLKDFHIKMRGKWNNLTSAEKATWDAKATKLMDEYRTEMQKWEEKMIAEGNIDCIRSRRSPSKSPKSKSKVDK